MSRFPSTLLHLSVASLLVLGLAVVYNESFLLFELGEGRMVIDSRQEQDVQ